MTTLDVLNNRVQVCKQCEHITKAFLCNMCKCFIPIKATFKDSKCPLNKWDNIK